MWLLLLLLVAVSFSKPLTACHEGQMHTDTETRKVFRCNKGEWTFHAMLLRPRVVTPMKAHISKKCEHNPNLNGKIAGFPCETTKHDHHVLACLNTHMSYICFEKKWHIYEVGNKK